jgi:hypothetical protein
VLFVNFIERKTSSGELRVHLRRAELDAAADAGYWKRHPQELAQRVANFTISATQRAQGILGIYAGEDAERSSSSSSKHAHHGSALDDPQYSRL